MSKVRLVMWAITFCFFGSASLVSAGSPPKFPGKTYFPTKDGCGFLVNDAELAAAKDEAKKFWQQQSAKYWIGNCLHGLIDGQGVFYDPAPALSFSVFYESNYLLGEDPFILTLKTVPKYSINLPNVQTGDTTGYRWGGTSGAGRLEYQVLDLREGKELSMPTAKFPVIWNQKLRTNPLFNLNDGSGGDDIKFAYSGELPDGEIYDSPLLGMNFEAAAKSCDDMNIKIKIKGCVPPGKVFDVYGVFIEGIANKGVAEFETQFIPCPNIRSSAGCEVVWQNSVGKYLDAMQAHAQMVVQKFTEQEKQLAEKRKVAEVALPASWKAHWAKNPINRDVVNTALRCREISDYGPISLQDAQYIQNKYSTAPCNAAVVAPAVLQSVSNFIQGEQKSISWRAKEIADLDQYNRDRAQARSEAWAGFFNSMNAVLSMQAQVQQQRIDQQNAQIAAQQQAANAAPIQYQSYGQPSSSSAAQQSYDPSKVQTRKIHKPELDAGSCVKLVQLANGDPLSSYGSQVFSNQCGQTVEVFWCKIGDECERGAGGMTTVAAGSSWPVTTGQYRYGACLGANSGALVRDASGVHTGRYACTGP